MSGSHRLRRTRRSRGRVVSACILLALAALVGVPGAAFGFFSSHPAARAASMTAATIAAPTNFTATAVASTTVNLSWTAPSNLTGYTLSQSPGTLAGCSATPSSSATSCTATGLSPKTTYTWTLTAVYQNWASSQVTAHATTFAVVGATLLGSATDAASGTKSSTVSGVTTSSGATLLVLVYREASGSTTINSIGGSAVSGTSTQINAEPFSSGNDEVFAWLATGSGTSSGNVKVNFSASDNVSTTIDVVQLSANNTTTPIARSAVSTGTGSTVTGGTLTGASASDGEVFFVGLSAATTLSLPVGYTVLDVPATTLHGSWFSSSASSSGVTTTLGASPTWATIEIEINHA